MWTFREAGFLPHAIAGTDDGEPLVIGWDDPPIEHDDVLINTTGAVPGHFARFGRLAEIVHQMRLHLRPRAKRGDFIGTGATPLPNMICRSTDIAYRAHQHRNHGQELFTRRHRSALVRQWETEAICAVRPRPSYCIPIPPPNVTGTLHMGHGFQQAIMDALIRYHRMRGHNTLWQVGTDHAGIATQMVVERQLEAEGTTREALGREAFIDRCGIGKRNPVAPSLSSRRLGTSPDWTRERFTMDPGLSEAVQSVFIALHEQGLIYRGYRLVNWDPQFLTAISDLEVVQEEETGSLWHSATR